MGRREQRIGHAGADRRIADEGLVSAEPQASQRGRINGAGDRPALFNERDIDGELAVARDEFPRSIQRIDQQESFGDGNAMSGRRRLFGDDRRPGDRAGETIADDPLGVEVRKRDGTPVGLGAGVSRLP